MRRDLPRAIADAASDIRTPFARALARGRAEFGRKDVRTASPRAGYSEKTFTRISALPSDMPRRSRVPARIRAASIIQQMKRLRALGSCDLHRKFAKKRVSSMTPIRASIRPHAPEMPLAFTLEKHAFKR
ncbi:hypothetical protein [Burkholderia ubonensis]|uniref:hypothetical protein n=1 Tax=Burkholderia ubonensis TaxID=101571 RepID=UPI000B1D550D|nr:hypothetical protein [Burkholderia ubonensis]